MVGSRPTAGIKQSINFMFILKTNLIMPDYDGLFNDGR